MQESDIIGQIVISSSFGIGRVVSIDEEGYGDQPFMIIESQKHKASHMVPLKDKKKYRTVASASVFKKMLNRLGTDSGEKDFESKKERIDYFKKNSRIQELNSVANLLVELNAIKDRGATEIQIYQKLIDNLAMECSIINEESIEVSTQTIIDMLQGGTHEQ